MARLIDGNALMNTLQKLFDKREKEQMFTGSRGSCVTWDDAIYHIKSAPTVDAVPVCRCAECKYNMGACIDSCGEPAIECITGQTHRRDWFCAGGESKGGDE